MILDEFDPAKPFYSLVLAYMCQVHGFFELVSVGLIQRFEKFCEHPAFKNLSSEERIAKYVSGLGAENQKVAEPVLRSGKTILMFKPVLLSQTAKGIKLDIPEFPETVFMEHDAAIRYFNRMSAGSLLILADDLVTKHRGDPIVQFLHHCRNAAAHNGVFTFKRGKKYGPAEWRTLKIVRTMQGDPLFADPPMPGFLGMGDAVYLLADIEKKFM